MRYLYILIILLVGFGCSEQKERPNLNKFNEEDLEAMQWPIIPTAIGTEDNPDARLEFDQLRYRDPATGRIPENIREKEIAFVSKLPVSSGFTVRDKNGFLRSIEADFSLAGPKNVGGRSRAVAIDVTNENVILAGGVSGGLWRTEDQGISWNRVTSVSDLPNIRSIVQDTRSGKENTWYYGTGEILPGSSAGAIGAPYRGNGIYKSTDGGKSWNRIPSTATGPISELTSPFNFVHNLAVDVSNSTQDEVYAAALGGIYRSTNGFSTHQLVLGHSNINSNNDGLWTEVAVTSTGVVYATLSNRSGDKTAPTGIFRSETGESGSWEDITPSDFEPEYRRIVIGIDPSNENIVYFLANRESINRLYKYDASAAEGAEWTDLSDNIPQFGGSVGDYNAQNSYNMLISVHPANSNVVFVGGTNLYRSTNAFANDTQTDWVGGYSRANTGEQYANHHADQHTLAFFPSNPNRMISGHDGGLSLTNNNLKSSVTTDTDEFGDNQSVMIEWQNLNNGYVTSQFYSIAFDEENINDPGLMGGLQDNSTQLLQEIDRDARWFNVGTGDGGFCYYDNESVILSAQYANIFRIYFENNEPPKNATISTPNAGDQSLGLFINPILVDPVAYNKVFVGGRGRIYYTLDVRKNPRDEEWYSFGTPTIDDNERVSAMGASENPGGILYIGTDGGHLYRTNNSTALNQISDITPSVFPSNGYISSIAVDPSNADRVIVAFSNYNVNSLFYSTNGGTSWQSISGNLESAGSSGGGAPSVRWVTIMPNGGGNIYLLGTSVGLMSSDNLNGNSTIWQREAVNTIGTIPVDMVRVRPIDGYIGVATHGNGIYEARIDVPLSARLQLADIRCESGEVVLKTNIQFSGSTDEFDLQYEWFVENEQIPDLNFPSVSTTTEGTYQVRITNSVNGETALSNEVVIDFSEANPQWCSGNPVVGIEDKIEGLEIFPNPATDKFQVRHPFSGPVQMRVLDSNGRFVFEQELNDQQEIIDISRLNPGLYIIMLQNGNKIISKKFLKR